MRNLAFYGFWTCAALYAAIGLIGTVVLSTQPDSASATDGYGTLHVTARQN